MQVDTDVFAAISARAAAAGDVAALAEEVAGLGRKITHLSGRVTIMSRFLGGELSTLRKVILAFLVPGTAAMHAKPKPRRDRHGLRAVGRGRR